MDTALLRRAAAMLDSVTPLRTDCGKLCNAACCKGEGEIWLLPGEEVFYKNNPAFTLKRYEHENGRVSYHAVCRENCWLSRETRPFSCKIFPLFPLVSIDAYDRIRIRLILDPRAKGLCPLTGRSDRITPRFCRRLRMAVRLLCKDPTLYDFFAESGNFLAEMEAFRRRLLSMNTPWETE